MAVHKPAELDFSDKKFMVIISGQPGLGKTTLALSAPAPFLFDTDNGIARVKAEHRCPTSTVSTYDELLEDMQSEDYCAAKTAVIDTGGTLVQLMKDWARQQDSKAAKDGRAMFGVIKSEFDRLCWQIRNQDKKHLVVVFHTTEQAKGDTIQTRLACEGSTKDIVWTPADLGGHMQMLGSRRMIGFTPTEEYFAKSCYGVSGLMAIPELRPGQKNTFLSDLFRKMHDTILQDAAVYSKERAAYEEAMQAGREIVELITDAQSADAALAPLAALEHALTSKAEISNIYKTKIKTLGLRYNTKEKHHEVLADTKPAE